MSMGKTICRAPRTKNDCLKIQKKIERLDFEYFYDDWLTYTDNTWTWCQAYNFAQVLIAGNLQKHKTENYTIGMNPDWEE